MAQEWCGGCVGAWVRPFRMTDRGLEHGTSSICGPNVREWKCRRRLRHACSSHAVVERSRRLLQLTAVASGRARLRLWLRRLRSRLPPVVARQVPAPALRGLRLWLRRLAVGLASSSRWLLRLRSWATRPPTWSWQPNPNQRHESQQGPQPHSAVTPTLNTTQPPNIIPHQRLGSQHWLLPKTHPATVLHKHAKQGRGAPSGVASPSENSPRKGLAHSRRLWDCFEQLALPMHLPPGSFQNIHRLPTVTMISSEGAELPPVPNVHCWEPVGKGRGLSRSRA